MELNTVSDALSGLQANQTFMDVVGNNISNVNTTAYKSQSIHFQDLINQSIEYGGAANNGLDGINPLQIGMGAGSGAINLINTQGAVKDTGRTTDMAIQGNGNFIVSNGQQNFYTRDGSFTVAPDGVLEVGSNGLQVQGWSNLTSAGTIQASGPVSQIKIPLGGEVASATSKVLMAGNLNSSSAVYAAGPPATGGAFNTTLTVYDSQGNSHTLGLGITKTTTLPTNTWTYNVTDPSGTLTLANNTGTLAFDANGNYVASGSTVPQLNIAYPNGTNAGNVAIDFTTLSQLSQTSQVNVATSDGTPAGTISTFNVGQDGVVTASYTNGTSKAVGQIALADFRNVDGLLRKGSNLYAQGVNSGAPQIGTAGSGTLGAIQTGQLEGSNVDLAAQFAQMIQAQQGFNANTKVITTTDNMLNQVISIVP